MKEGSNNIKLFQGRRGYSCQRWWFSICWNLTQYLLCCFCEVVYNEDKATSEAPVACSRCVSRIGFHLQLQWPLKQRGAKTLPTNKCIRGDKSTKRGGRSFDWQRLYWGKKGGHPSVLHGKERKPYWIVERTKHRMALWSVCYKIEIEYLMIIYLKCWTQFVYYWRNCCCHRIKTPLYNLDYIHVNGFLAISVCLLAGVRNKGKVLSFRVSKRVLSKPFNFPDRIASRLKIFTHLIDDGVIKGGSRKIPCVAVAVSPHVW